MSKIAIDRVPGVRFLGSGRNEVGPGWHISRHGHAFYELIVLLRGTEDVFFGQRQVKAGPRDILLFPPGQEHEEFCPEGDGQGLCSIFIAFEWDEPDPGLPLVEHDRDGRATQLASWLHAEHEGYFAGVEAFHEAMMAALLAEYTRLGVKEENHTVERVRTYVRDHLPDPLRVDKLAHVAGMSKYHFIRCYRQFTGMTPMEDVRRIRVQSARHLLLTTNLPLKAIAPRVGLANEYHLSRLLKKHLGAGARDLRNSTGSNA